MKHTHRFIFLALLLVLAQPCRGDEPLLEYEELITGGADPATALPVLVAVHGLGGSPTTFKRLFSTWDDVPARVILPRGPTKHGRGWSWFETVIRGGAVKKVSTKDIRGNATRLAALIRHLAATKPLVGRPIITGFSQGGVMSFTVASLHPELVSAAIPMGGWLPEEFIGHGGPSPRGPPIRALHGEADTLVPYQGTVDVVARLKEQGWDVTLTGFPRMGHTVGDEMRKTLKRHIKEFFAELSKQKVR